VEQTEGAHAVQTAQRHVLEEAAQKLVGRQGHGLALAVAAVTVGEGDGVVVAGGDGLVGERGAVCPSGKRA
jgi:diacylglycerol kinase family enzyme